MPKVTLSSKNQITLPVEVVRKLGLKPGDKIVAELMDDHVVLLPQPESWVDYFAGSLKGVYGSTKEEIDRYIAEVRYGWDIDALKDALAVDEELRRVYGAVPILSEEGISLSEIRKKSGVALADQHLEKLERLHAVKRLKHPVYTSGPYYRRIP